MTTYDIGYMAGRERADRRLYWTTIARDLAIGLLFAVFLAAEIVWVIAPMPPVLP